MTCDGNCALLGLPCECAPRPPGRPAFRPCGTMAAYRRHQRHGETPCRECKQAFSRWWQDRGRELRAAARERRRRVGETDPWQNRWRDARRAA